AHPKVQRRRLVSRSAALVRLLAKAAALLFVTVIPAFAQVTTGNVSGTVKDPQGGVIPGATVLLISEARGTMSTPVVTNATGDFVFPNVTNDTYTIRVSMDGFKTSERKGVTVSPGDRLAVGTLTME